MSNGPIENSRPFLLGAFLGLPSVLTLPGAVYAGLAFMNGLCRDLIVRDCPWAIVILGGALYRITLGAVLPILMFGTLTHFLVRWGDGRLTRWLGTAPRGARVFSWIIVLAIALPGAIVTSVLAYGLPILLLR